jgi:hypothetical protein
MENKKTVIINVSYLVELSDDELDLNNDNSTLDKIISEIGEDKNLLVNDRNIEFKWTRTSSLLLEPKEMNCGRCVSCGQWTTDKEKPNDIKEICNGATVDGRLLCDDCLPPNHRWAF